MLDYLRAAGLAACSSKQNARDRQAGARGRLTIGAPAAGLTVLPVMTGDAFLEVPAVAWASVGTVHQVHCWGAAPFSWKKGAVLDGKH